MTEPGHWTRRSALAALAASAGAPALARAMPAAPSIDMTGLREIARAATATPPPFAVGATHAAGWTRTGIEAALLARLGPGAGDDWRFALVESGRRDLARRDMVEIGGLPVMRTEAELLALGVLLRREGMV